MRVLENLEPKEVFSYFEDICSIRMDPEIRSRSVITV